MNVTVQYKRCMHLSIMIVFMYFIVTSISGLYQYEWRIIYMKYIHFGI